MRIIIRGIPELERKLSPDSIDNMISDFVYTVAKKIKKYTSEYPPLSEANDPANPRGYWYERGYGWKGRVNNPVSEQLNERWDISRRNKGVIITNSASYSIYVHKEEDQARIHNLRGWRTDKEGIEEVKPQLDNIMTDTLRDFWL